MKLPFTEEFLWSLYKIIVSDPDKPYKIIIPRSWQELVYPEYSEMMMRHKIKKDAEKFRKLIHYLKKKGLIKTKEINNKEALIITPRGQEKVSKIIAKVKSANLKKRKDGKWQMIMYDIPASKERERKYFGKELKLLGYQMIQKSVWASPYNVVMETKDLVEKYKLQDFVRFLLVQEINIEN